MTAHVSDLNPCTKSDAHAYAIAVQLFLDKRLTRALKQPENAN
jgi:hypothetical protein